MDDTHILNLEEQLRQLPLDSVREKPTPITSKKPAIKKSQQLSRPPTVYPPPSRVTVVSKPYHEPIYKRREFKTTLKVLGGLALIVTSIYIFKFAKHAEEEATRYIISKSETPTSIVNQQPSPTQEKSAPYRPTTDLSQGTTSLDKKLNDTNYKEEKKSSQDEIRNVRTESYSTSPVLYANESFKVYANRSSWQSTNINVNNGDIIDFSASGSVVHWQSADKKRTQSCGPDGRGGQGIGPTYLVSGLNDMGLVGKIGSYTFNVGSSSRIVAQDSGVLSFGINDTNRYGGCADNSGNWTVKVKAYRK